MYQDHQPITQTLSSMYSTDIKRGRQINQGEDSDTILMVQKRSKKSELEYRFQCPLCPKKYASYLALYFHKKQKHPQ